MQNFRLTQMDESNAEVSRVYQVLKCPKSGAFGVLAIRTLMSTSLALEYELVLILIYWKKFWLIDWNLIKWLLIQALWVVIGSQAKSINFFYFSKVLSPAVKLVYDEFPVKLFIVLCVKVYSL